MLENGFGVGQFELPAPGIEARGQIFRLEKLMRKPRELGADVVDFQARFLGVADFHSEITGRLTVAAGQVQDQSQGFQVQVLAEFQTDPFQADIRRVAGRALGPIRSPIGEHGYGQHRPPVRSPRPLTHRGSKRRLFFRQRIRAQVQGIA